MKDVNEERLDEYNEEIALLTEGVAIYKKKVDSTERIEPKWDAKTKLFELQLSLKSKTAAALQLGELMNKQEEQTRAEIKDMKEHWHNILKSAMDSKDRYPKDIKRMVIGIKDTHIRKAFQNDKHKLSAYKTLKSIMQKYPNGKSI